MNQIVKGGKLKYYFLVYIYINVYILYIVYNIILLFFYHLEEEAHYVMVTKV